MKPVIKIHTQYPDVLLPIKSTAEAACYDIFSYLKAGDSITSYNGNNDLPQKVKDGGWFNFWPGSRVLVPTGIIFDIPDGYSIRFHPRSGLSIKLGVTLVNCEGVIDSDYCHPVFITLINLSSCAVEIQDGMRLAQFEMVKNLEHDLSWGLVLDKLPDKTDRIGGFGSTGK